jgi:Ca2+-binding RTX toxin-like protein
MASPVLTAGAAATYTENDGYTPVVIDNTILLTEADTSTIASAKVSITSGFTFGQDFLRFTNTGAITGSYDAGTGVLSLTGTTTVANYQAALRSVSYNNLSEDPSATGRVVTFSVVDPQAETASATSTLAVTPVNNLPDLEESGAQAVFQRSATVATPVAVDPGLMLTDADSANMASATVRIVNYVAGEDVLAGGGGVFNATTGVLTITGSASRASYESNLRSVTYTDTSATPVEGARTIEFIVNDGTGASDPAFVNVSVSLVTTVTPPTPPPGGTTPGAGDDTLTGTGSADTIEGLAGNDQIDGGSGNDSLAGNEGNDFIRGLDDHDTVDGGVGNDTVNGNMGSDYVYGGAGADSVHGGRDNDYVWGGDGDDVQVNGNIGDDVVHGDAGNDSVYGGQNSDTIYGDDGNDYLSGDLGNDIMNGGAGADRFGFALGGGADWVEDFNFSQGDRIQLAAGTVYTTGSVQGQALIYLSDGSVLGLAGVASSSFSADWVVYA